MAKKFQCKDDDFMVQSDNEDEIAMMVGMHAMSHHPDLEISSKSIKENIEEVQAM